MSYSPIGDTVALTKLAYTLYSRVIVVARDAPEQFAELLQDLDLYKSILYRIKIMPRTRLMALQRNLFLIVAATPFTDSET